MWREGPGLPPDTGSVEPLSHLPLERGRRLGSPGNAQPQDTRRPCRGKHADAAEDEIEGFLIDVGSHGSRDCGAGCLVDFANESQREMKILGPDEPGGTHTFHAGGDPRLSGRDRLARVVGEIDRNKESHRRNRM